MRRALWETLANLAEAVQPAAGAGLRVHAVHLDLPIEVALVRTGADWDLLADLPRWRWRGGFDEQPSRLRLSLALVPSPEGGDRR
jgi:hypothetical protein